jgi:multicomponent Na+:H+ antiporter subunit B
VRFPFGSDILDAAARLIAPFILLFAVYVVAHGHDSPGGGFQGGVLLAAGLILVKLVRGFSVGWQVGPSGALALACAGVALFAGIGLVALVFDGNYLDYSAAPVLEDPVVERVLGTLGIEIGVALAVTGVILVVFDALAGWGYEDDTPWP